MEDTCSTMGRTSTESLEISFADGPFSSMNNDSPLSKLRSLWPLGLAGLFMLCGILVLVYIGRDTARLMNGPLGEIELVPLLKAGDKSLVASPTGKVLVVHFWGTWCPVCRKEFPAFVELHKKFQSRPDVTVLSVGCLQATSGSLEQLRTETEDYLRSMDVDMPIYADPNLFTRGRITRMLAAGGFGYPFTLVVDKQGIVRDYWMGGKTGAMKEVDKLIEQLANESLSANQTREGRQDGE